MADSWNKREREKKKQQLKKEKEERKKERKEQAASQGTDDMIAWVDENGNITNKPPVQTEKPTYNLEDIQISVPKRTDEDPGDTSRRGKLTVFHGSRGFGFIDDEASGESIFVHLRDMKQRIKEGDTVLFDLGSGPKGPYAFNVRLPE